MKRFFQFSLGLVFSASLLAQTRAVIGTGSASNDGTGDSIQTAFKRVNTNFLTLWNHVFTNGGSSDLNFNTNWFRVTGTNVEIRTKVYLTNDFQIQSGSVGASDYGVRMYPLNLFYAGATDLTINGYSTGLVTSSNLIVKGMTELDLMTPLVVSSGATTGHYLKLMDASSGRAEWASTPFLPLAGGTMSGAINMGSQKITSLGTPTVSTDAATKDYVDSVVFASNPITGDSRNNLIANVGINILADTNAATQAVTLTGAGGSSRNVIGSASLTTISAGAVASGVVMAGRSHYVSGTTGSVVYNGSTNALGATFTGVYGVRTYTATGDATVKNPVTRLADTAYTAGQAYVSTISGGYDHLNNQIAGTITGGGHNELRSGGNHAIIAGGSYNVQKAGLYSVIGGGTQNEQSQDFGIIGGGWANTISSDNVAGADYSAITSGDENRITDAFAALIAAGANNVISNPSSLTPSANRHNTIVNGVGNALTGGQFTSVLNGNTVAVSGDSSFYNTVLNGQSITLAGTCSYTLVGGTTISVNGLSRGIGWGESLTMTGGTHNYLFGNGGTLSGGSYNFSLGNANVVNGTQVRTFSFGTANTISGADTDIQQFGSSNTSSGTIYGGQFGFNNQFGTSSSYDWQIGKQNTTSTGATFMFQFGEANAATTSDYGMMFGKSNTIANQSSPATQAQYASASGLQASARSWGQRAESNGNLNSTINVQRSRYLASRRYAHATGLLSTDVRLDGTGQYIMVPDNSIWMVRAAVVGSMSDGSKYGAWTVDFAVRKNSGTLSVLGSPSYVIVYNGHASTWSIAPAIRSSPEGITISVTALDGETVNWSASIDTTEMSSAW